MKAEKAKNTDNLKPCPFCGSSGDSLEITCADLLDAQDLAVGQIEILPDTNQPRGLECAMRRMLCSGSERG